MTLKPFILGVALALPAVMFGQSIPNTSKQLTSSGRHFVKKLAQEDMSEIRLAHLALKRSSNPQVRNYAQRILSADPSMEQGAKKIAEKDNVTVPTSPSPRQQTECDRLAALSGKRFDRAYMNYEARKQKADLDLVRHEISAASNAQLKAFARNEETPVRNASEMA